MEQKIFERKRSFEVMNVPELVSEIEWDAQLLSILFKAHDVNFGDRNSEFAKEIGEHFKDKPLSREILQQLDEILSVFDDETLYNLSLAYNHSERLPFVREMIRLNKNVEGDIEATEQKFFELLRSFEAIFSETPIASRCREELARDCHARMEQMEKTRAYFQHLIDFFLVDADTTKTRRVNLIPTDRIAKKESGRACFFGDEQVIFSHIENESNQGHEFLHGVINPIVDKIANELTDTEQDKISRMGSYDLKVSQEYGDHWYSLVCEELIRVFQEAIEYDRSLMTFERFSQIVEAMTEEDFQRYLEDDKLRTSLIELDIYSLDDLRKNRQSFYDKRVALRECPLRKLVYDLYQEYQSRNDTNVNFENFFLVHFRERLAMIDF